MSLLSPTWRVGGTVSSSNWWPCRSTPEVHTKSDLDSGECEYICTVLPLLACDRDVCYAQMMHRVVSHITAVQLSRRLLSTNCDPGLFGIAGLHRPSDFLRLGTETKRACDSILHSLSLAQPSAGVVQLMVSGGGSDLNAHSMGLTVIHPCRMNFLMR